jgi:hypothetical protein
MYKSFFLCAMHAAWYIALHQHVQIAPLCVLCAMHAAWYIAPEVLHVGIMSKAADVYSFGMVLHEVRCAVPLEPPCSVTDDCAITS